MIALVPRTLYALFDRAADADAAKRAVEALEREPRRCFVSIHARRILDEPLSELALPETAGAAKLVQTAIVGALIGAALALFLTRGGSAGVPTMVFMGVILGLLGAFAGAIAGASVPDPAFAELARAIGAGKLVVVVQAPTWTLAESAGRVLRRHHGHVVPRGLFGRGKRAAHRVVRRYASM